MRIIDKNHDFYDYLQDPTDNTLVFDRRNSFILEKSKICEALGKEEIRYRERRKYFHLSLQCGGTFWIFLLTVTEYGGTVFLSDNMPSNYNIELLATWRNYDKPNKLIDLAITHCSFNHIDWHWKTRKYTLKRDKIDPDDIATTFDRYKQDTDISLNTLTVFTDQYNHINRKKKTYDIPILRATGIANLVNPVDVFCGIEEYFSREKTAAERTEPLGATNNDKIIMHGFDTKTSFRGKQ